MQKTARKEPTHTPHSVTGGFVPAGPGTDSTTTRRTTYTGFIQIADDTPLTSAESR